MRPLGAAGPADAAHSVADACAQAGVFRAQPGERLHRRRRAWRMRRHRADLPPPGRALAGKDLAARGMLRARADDAISSCRGAAALPPRCARCWPRSRRRLADDAPLLAYLRRCGELVADVLTGRDSPLETLFPGGSFETGRRSLPALGGGALRQRHRRARHRGAGRGRAGGIAALRVLEIGAGTGGTTAGLLPRCPPNARDYVFTDVSDFFLDRAARTFAAYPFVDYGLLDIERRPSAGLAAGQLRRGRRGQRAARDARPARRTLRHARAAGAGRHAAARTKSTAPAWFDMTTGLIEGWQRFDDGLRGDNPLLEPEQWMPRRCAPTASPASVRAWPEAGRRRRARPARDHRARARRRTRRARR